MKSPYTTEQNKFVKQVLNIECHLIINTNFVVFKLTLFLPQCLQTFTTSRCVNKSPTGNPGRNQQISDNLLVTGLIKTSISIVKYISSMYNPRGTCKMKYFSELNGIYQITDHL